KDPAARYPTAQAFAQDLERWQRREPLLARPPSALGRTVKWVRRNRAAARALLAAALAILVAGGWTLLNARRSTLRALEAARLGALAESMDARQRMEPLSTPHDLRPAKARLRAEVDGLRPRAAEEGPAGFALGKGLLLLGETEAAQAALQRAWDSG